MYLQVSRCHIVFSLNLFSLDFGYKGNNQFNN